MKAVCVCSTLGRLAYLPRAVAMFLRQDHEDSILVIINEVIPGITCPIICDQSITNKVQVMNMHASRWEDRVHTHRKAWLAAGEERWQRPRRFPGGQHDILSRDKEEAFVLWDDDDVHMPSRVSSLLSGFRLDIDVVRHDSYVYMGETEDKFLPLPHPADRAVRMPAFLLRWGVLDYPRPSGYDQHMLKAARAYSVCIPGCHYGYCFGGNNYHLSTSLDDEIKEAAREDTKRHAPDGVFYLSPDFVLADRLIERMAVLIVTD